MAIDGKNAQLIELIVVRIMSYYFYNVILYLCGRSQYVIVVNLSTYPVIRKSLVGPYILAITEGMIFILGAVYNP